MQTIGLFNAAYLAERKAYVFHDRVNWVVEDVWHVNDNVYRKSVDSKVVTRNIDEHNKRRY